MNNDQNNEVFAFTYSASQQEEVRRIREKYMPREEEVSKLEQLRRLDAGVTQKASTVSLIIGIISSLVLGVGMCCCMVWSGVWFIPGILIGLVGILGVCMAYPVYERMVRKERERIAPEILRLTDELMK